MMLTADRLGNHVLFLFIGPQRELVTLHTEIIPTAVQEHINERSAGLQLYELAEQDPDIFRIYRGYLYTRRIYSIGAADRNGPDSNDLKAILRRRMDAPSSPLPPWRDAQRREVR